MILIPEHDFIDKLTRYFKGRIITLPEAGLKIKILDVWFMLPEEKGYWLPEKGCWLYFHVDGVHRDYLYAGSFVKFEFELRVCYIIQTYFNFDCTINSEINGTMFASMFHQRYHGTEINNVIGCSENSLA